jgi:hypothetical protein
MGSVVFDVKDRIGSPEGMAGREYDQRVYSPVIVLFCGLSLVCKET